jgi:hypothetical protein
MVVADSSFCFDDLLARAGTCKSNFFKASSPLPLCPSRYQEAKDGRGFCK